MPTPAKPLFRPEALRPKLTAFAVPPAAPADLTGATPGVQDAT